MSDNGTTAIPDDDDGGGNGDDTGNIEHVFDGAILINPFLLCFSSLLFSFSSEFSAIHNLLCLQSESHKM